MMQLLAQFLKKTPLLQNVHVKLSSPQHLTVSLVKTQISHGQSLWLTSPSLVFMFTQNNSFIVIFLMFVFCCHLYLFLCFPSCFATEGDKRQMKPQLSCSARLSMHKAPLCGSLSVCPGPDCSWQRH